MVQVRSLNSCDLFITLMFIQIPYSQAKNFDGKIPQWHHFDCFYKKTTPPDCNLIQGYSDVRWEDQQKIKAKFEGIIFLL